MTYTEPMNRIPGVIVVFVNFILLTAPVRADDWPAWRGPRGDGTSTERNVPVHWGASENIVWKQPLPGVGHSSPIVCGDRIFTLSALLEPNDRAPERGGNSEFADSAIRDRVLLCLDRSSGEILWQRTVVSCPLEGKHRLNSWASSTPAADGETVYVTFLDRADMVVAAYDFSGNLRWLVRPGTFKSVHGFCSSPVLYKNTVIVNGDHDGDAYLAALDRQTGRTIWTTPRENKTRSYCVPLIRQLDGRPQMLLSGSKSVASFNPDTGERHWVIDGPTEQFVASLVENKGLVFVTGGYPDHHLLAIRPTGKDNTNVTDTHIVWRDTKGVSYVPSPAAAGDFFFVVSDDGIASCLDAVTGKRYWTERLGEHHSASLVTAGDRVYFLSDSGVMRVVRVARSFERIAENRLEEECYASPAISNGQIFIRADRNLYCIGNDAAASR
jgi:outer membrane protein assembly factor BamB